MKELSKQVLSFCKDSNDKLSLLANLSALLNQNTPDINWIGFYLYKDGALHLGPFQGKVACTLIQIGKGVCGTSFEKKMLLNIKNVHEFPGHIACDLASNSELVVPLIYHGIKVGVLDIDSTSYNRFNQDDEDTMQEVADIIAEYLCKKN